MARHKSDLEIEFEDATRNWICVNKKVDPSEWAAWIEWRRDNLHSLIEPENLTVPTSFPPLSVSAAKEYIEIVRKGRRLIGWNDSRSRITNDPSAWMSK